MIHGYLNIILYIDILQNYTYLYHTLLLLNTKHYTFYNPAFNFTMASQATRQRKGGVAPKSGEVFRQVSYAAPTGEGSTASNINVSANNSISTQTKHAVTATPTVLKVAKVKRSKFGTSPWDENWLNLDCCGLFCAAVTYMLHVYGVYATCVILIPPWMSTVDKDGKRTITMMGHLNRVSFTLIAVLAVYAHFKAMTTDPGAGENKHFVNDYQFVSFDEVS
jgi:hypothetical protein